MPRLLERGHQVVATVRRPDAVLPPGVQAVPGDILDASSLMAAAHGCDAAFHLATAIPDWPRTDRIRREGTANLLAACAAGEVRLYVQQSIIFLYGDQGDRLVDETTPLQPSPFIQSAADMEELVQASSLNWCILRGGAFYGPGTGAEEGWRGASQLPLDGRPLLSPIHVVDMARAAVLAAESAPARSIYNVVDDEPVSYRDLYAYLGNPAGPGGPATRSLACSNARIKQELGWTPAYPTFRSGMAK